MHDARHARASFVSFNEKTPIFLMSNNWNLFPHQLACLAKLRSVYLSRSSLCKGFFDNSVMGAGKTRTILSFFLLVLKLLLFGDHHDDDDDDHHHDEKVCENVSCSMLVLCPVAVIKHWEDEIKAMGIYVPVYSYQGSKRFDDWKKIQTSKSFILLSSLETLRADWKRHKTLIFHHQWHLLVVDEAHNWSNLERKNRRPEETRYIKMSLTSFAGNLLFS